MDQDRFDELVLRLGAARSRRSALVTGLAVLLPVATLADSPPVAAKRPKQCGPCEVRQGKRRCKPAPDNRGCKGNGRCLRGKCNPRPTCLVGTGCTTDSDCCSGNCTGAPDFLYCDPSGPGERCFATGNCFLGTCVGYRCRE